MTRSTRPATARSAATRPGGLVSSAPWWRRFTLPRAWKVCTTGRPSGAAADTAAMPDIQKWACTTSGRRAAQSAPRVRANAGR